MQSIVHVVLDIINLFGVHTTAKFNWYKRGPNLHSPYSSVSCEDLIRSFAEGNTMGVISVLLAIVAISATVLNCVTSLGTILLLSNLQVRLLVFS